MKITKNELHKIKDEYQNDFKNKIYSIFAKPHYSGNALVYAESVEDANKQIDDFKKSDPDNKQDSRGYSNVDEEDFTGQLTDEEKEITGGIYYTG